MKTQNAEDFKKREIADFVRYDLFALAYILRGITSESLAVSAAGLADEMKLYLGKEYSVRTLDRKLSDILDIQAWDKEQRIHKRKYKKEMAQILYCIYGGRILTTGNKYKKYYFEPCLDNASMHMLNGVVLSNRFLSQEEKAYLLTRMKLMNMLGELNELPDEDDNDETIAPMPSEEDNIFPGDNSRFIKNTVLLDYAIREKLQVEITYGIYDVYENGIDYHHRMENGKNKIYRLNPYALFWGDGHYYLLATYVSGYEPPYMKEKDTNINFRVDRIIDVRIVKEKGAVCEKIPKRLKNFFDTEGIFDDVSYSARFPGMRISEHSNMIDCIIECTPWSLQILVDTFGTLIEVSESRREHKKNEVDYNGRKQKFLEVKIKQVEFENIRDYCLSHPEYITPVEPKELVMAVKDKLTECLKKLEY